MDKGSLSGVCSRKLFCYRLATGKLPEGFNVNMEMSAANEYTSGVALSPFMVSFRRDVKLLVPCQIHGRKGKCTHLNWPGLSLDHRLVLKPIPR